MVFESSSIKSGNMYRVRLGSKSDIGNWVVFVFVFFELFLVCLLNQRVNIVWLEAFGGFFVVYFISNFRNGCLKLILFLIFLFVVFLFLIFFGGWGEVKRQYKGDLS